MNALAHLNAIEGSCLVRYLTILQEFLGTGLVQVWLFGSAARGDMWRRDMPMNSDIDLLLITRGELSPDHRQTLVNETYPLYLECGRQISPQFWPESKYCDPPTEVARDFKQRLLQEGKIILQP